MSRCWYLEGMLECHIFFRHVAFFICLKREKAPPESITKKNNISKVAAEILIFLLPEPRDMNPKNIQQDMTL